MARKKISTKDKFINHSKNARKYIRGHKWFTLGVAIILLVLLSLWAGKGVFLYGVFITHDGNHHLARSYDAIQAVKEGHFPLRWAGSLNYMCGIPIFNFFYPLIYYLVILVNLIVGEVYLSLKLIYLATFVVGTVSFFLWIREETKDSVAAFAGALLYLYAPYRFLLMFVRGSPEFIAYAIFPLVLYFYALSFQAKVRNKQVIYLTITSLIGALLIISHNFAVMFLMPLILVYLILKFIQEGKSDTKKYVFFAVSYIGMFALSSFFIIPVLFEKQYTKIGTSNVINYKDHFPTLLQLIRSKWEYFYSTLGVEQDGMSFMLGYAHWVVLGSVFLWLIYKLLKTKRKSLSLFVINNIWVLVFFLLSILTILLILPWSIFVWEKLPLIQEIQFSWRLLGIAVFLISALFSFFLVDIKGKWLYWPIIITICLLAIYGNRNHLLPNPGSFEETYLYSDFEKLHYFRFSTTTLGDDIIYPSASGACYYTTPEIASNKDDVLEYEVVDKGNTYGHINLFLGEENIEKSEKFIFGLSFFPDAYEFKVNGNEVLWEDCNGLVCVDVNSFKEGENKINWVIKQTKIQKTSNYASVMALLLLLSVVSYVILTSKTIKKS